MTGEEKAESLQGAAKVLKIKYSPEARGSKKVANHHLLRHQLAKRKGTGLAVPFEPTTRIELVTYGLRNRCSTI